MDSKCPECGRAIGSNDRCRNCADYQDYFADEYFDRKDSEAWEEALDLLWSLQDG